MKIHFDIEGATIRFRVVIPDPCSKTCRRFLPYAVGVFYPGLYHRTG